MKSADGMIQESRGPGAVGTILSLGLGVVRLTQISPFDGAAKTTLPSAEQAADCHISPGALFDSHVAPEFVEEYTKPF